MRKLPLLVLALLSFFLPSLAQAEEYPDTLSLGGGFYNFDKVPRTERVSNDFRLEYRSGLSLLPLLSDSFNDADSVFQIHPTVGLEANTKGAVYASAGINLDIPFLYYGIFTWGETVGVFGVGDDVRPLGSILQFRSQVELGFRFENNLRITGFISHLSNAHIVDDNPGAEIVGVYMHVPLSLFDNL